MKYIKKFYESNNWNYSQSELEEMINGCKDILKNLSDNDFSFNIEFHQYTWIKFNLMRVEDFTYSDVEEVIETLKSYLGDWGFKIDWQSPEEVKNQRPTIRRMSVMNPTTFIPEKPVSRCSVTFRF
jgi:hypothetical protein